MPTLNVRAGEPSDRPPAERLTWRTRTVPIVFVSAVSLLATLVSFGIVRELEERDLQSEFRRLAGERTIAIREALEDDLRVLSSVSALYDSSRHVDREEFRDFASAMRRAEPTIHALEWIPRVSAAERETRESEARTDGLAGFRLTERGPGGEPVAVGERAEYFPVFYVEPVEGNAAGLGFDLGSDVTRRAALDAARDAGRPIATAKIMLVQEGGDQPAFLIFLPRYREAAPVETVADRRENLSGFILGVFRARDLLASALESFDPAEIVLRLEDRSVPAGEGLLAARGPGSRLAEVTAVAAPASSRFSQETSFNFAGRDWAVTAVAAPGFAAAGATVLPWVVLAGGLTITAMLAGYVGLIVGRAARIEHVVQERTAELASKTKSLEQAIVERTRAEATLKKSQTLLSEANERLSQVNQELEQFVYTASHDLKSPLVTIQGFIGHLRRDVAENRLDRIEQFAARIDRATRRMRQNIDDLLELSRIGRAVNDAVSVDMNKLLEAVVADHAITIEQRQVTLEIAESLPVIFADEIRIAQIFENLIGNALKYGCTGERPHIEVGAERTADEIRFFVRDDGPGIAPEHRERIFQLFQRLETGADGTGIGLAIVQRAAEVNGGRAWVESEPGRGATFWVAFPVTADADASAAAA